MHRWESLQAFADAIGDIKGKRVSKSTVQYWDQKGFIPSNHHPDVLQAGQKLDPPVMPEDFFTADAA